MAPRRGPGPRSHPRTLIQNAAGLGRRQPRTPAPSPRRPPRGSAGPGAAGGDARRGRGLRRPPARRHAGEEPVQPGGRWLRLPRPAAQRRGLPARHPLPGQGEPRPRSPGPGGALGQGAWPAPPPPPVRAPRPRRLQGAWAAAEASPGGFPPQRRALAALACCRPAPGTGSPRAPGQPVATGGACAGHGAAGPAGSRPGLAVPPPVLPTVYFFSSESAPSPCNCAPHLRKCKENTIIYERLTSNHHCQTGSCSFPTIFSAVWKLPCALHLRTDLERPLLTAQWVLPVPGACAHPCSIRCLSRPPSGRTLPR